MYITQYYTIPIGCTAHYVVDYRRGMVMLPIYEWHSLPMFPNIIPFSVDDTLMFACDVDNEI